MKTTFFAVALMMIAMPALALDLQGARSQGLIGEKTDGYISVLKSSKEVDELTAEVNAKRKAEYARISKENGQPVDVVAKLAAGQVIAKLPAGAMYQDASGNWKAK